MSNRLEAARVGAGTRGVVVVRLRLPGSSLLFRDDFEAYADLLWVDGVIVIDVGNVEWHGFVFFHSVSDVDARCFACAVAVVRRCRLLCPVTRTGVTVSTTATPFFKTVPLSLR